MLVQTYACLPAVVAMTACTSAWFVVQVVKVLHGADRDIQWLQRDFGIYMANMFDTGQAARVLEFPGHGLAYLLQHFCAIKVGLALLSNDALCCAVPWCAELSCDAFVSVSWPGLGIVL